MKAELRAVQDAAVEFRAARRHLYETIRLASLQGRDTKQISQALDGLLSYKTISEILDGDR